MLLEAGYPANWGTTYDFNPDRAERFGLALSGSSSSYVLDPDKVQRLVVGNPMGFIEYEDVPGKLKLEGYGFTFRIIPPFKVIVNDKDFDGESNPFTLGNLIEGVNVSVTNNEGHPIPKASVKATIVYALKKNETFTIVKANNYTDAVGRCIIGLPVPDGTLEFVIVFKVTVADVKAVTSSYMEGSDDQRVINASLVGDNVTLSVPEGPGWEKDSSGTRWVSNIVVVSEEEDPWNMYSGTQTNEDKITWGEGQWG